MASRRNKIHDANSKQHLTVRDRALDIGATEKWLRDRAEKKEAADRAARRAAYEAVHGPIPPNTPER